MFKRTTPELTAGEYRLIMMRVQLQWDNPEQTIVRWDFEGWIGLVNYIIPTNDTATMGILNGGQADVIINIGMKFPFPNCLPANLRAPMLAARSYNLGYIVAVTRNPVAVGIIRAVLGQSADVPSGFYIVPSLWQARELIALLRADPTNDIRMRM